jgi:hypothetical protein
MDQYRIKAGELLLVKPFFRNCAPSCGAQCGIQTGIVSPKCPRMGTLVHRSSPPHPLPLAGTSGAQGRTLYSPRFRAEVNSGRMRFEARDCTSPPVSPSPFHVEDPATGGAEGDQRGEVLSQLDVRNLPLRGGFRTYEFHRPVKLVGVRFYRARGPHQCGPYETQCLTGSVDLQRLENSPILDHGSQNGWRRRSGG